jgi:hypothetical protein
MEIQNDITFLAELSKEIDTHFQEIASIIHETDEQFLFSIHPGMIEETNFAKPSNKFPINDVDIREISKLVHAKILELELQKITMEKTETLFHPLQKRPKICMENLRKMWKNIGLSQSCLTC